MLHDSLKTVKFWRIPAIAAALAFIVFFVWIFPSRGTLKVSAQDLMKEVKANKVDVVDLKDDFLKSTADFSVDLFKQAYAKDKNSLVSPASVYLALGMTANGADGNTLKEFETLLGKYGLNIKDLNSYYKTLAKKLTNVNTGKISISNSIWYNDDKTLNVKQDFLQTNADYYNASAYKADFKSIKTVKDINNWVKFNTGKKIDEIIDKIDDNTVMYLINTIYFEDKWENVYNSKDVHEGGFQLTDGSRIPVNFMHSTEVGYLSDNMGEGFIKPYKNGKYSFVTLLPNEKVSIDKYVNSLSGESFTKLLKSKLNENVVAELPKFKAEYNVELVPALKRMGINEGFDVEKANFGKMGSSKQGNIYIGDILHKTFISVDTEGTKAAAATKVEMKSGAAPSTHFIKLNRPFVYAIVDNETNLPIFMGAMMSPEKVTTNSKYNDIHIQLSEADIQAQMNKAEKIAKEEIPKFTSFHEEKWDEFTIVNKTPNYDEYDNLTGFSFYLKNDITKKIGFVNISLIPGESPISSFADNVNPNSIKYNQTNK